VLVAGEEVTLTPTEYKILELLSATVDQVFSREQLLQQVLPEEHVLDMRTIDAHISRLRKKINRGTRSYIQTVYGFGYRFGVTDED
jgi:DNA-binding response OmpR family regulator